MPPKQPIRYTCEKIWDVTFLVDVAAVPIPLNVHSDTIMVQADPDNVGDVFVGSVTSQSWQLGAGAQREIRINNPNKVYVRGSVANQRVNVHALGT